MVKVSTTPAGQSTAPKDANELIDEMTQHPTLDEYMLRDPSGLSDADLMRLIEGQRAARALYIKGKQ